MPTNNTPKPGADTIAALRADNNARLGIAMASVIGFTTILIFIVAAVGGASGPAVATCKSDYTKCVDNSDMANHYDGWRHARHACEIKAADRAKYGSPKWPWPAFSTFYPGKDYSTGIVTLIEPDAQFQNGFGAMAHVEVLCKYDLREERVLNVLISER